MTLRSNGLFLNVTLETCLEHIQVPSMPFTYNNTSLQVQDLTIKQEFTRKIIYGWDKHQWLSDFNVAKSLKSGQCFSWSLFVIACFSWTAFSNIRFGWKDCIIDTGIFPPMSNRPTPWKTHLLRSPSTRNSICPAMCFVARTGLVWRGFI